MGYYIGHFYVSKRDVFLLAAAGVSVFMLYQGLSMPYIETKYFLTLILLALFAKGILLPTNDTVLYLTFLVALALTLFVPFLQVLIFLFFSFMFLHISRII